MVVLSEMGCIEKLKSVPGDSSKFNLKSTENFEAIQIKKIDFQESTVIETEGNHKCSYVWTDTTDGIVYSGTIWTAERT